MRAVLLAAGLGTRLKPLTNTIPKCLVPIGGRPLLDYWIEKLIKLGISKILINTHYKSELVEAFVHSHKYREQIYLSHETELLDTGGTLINNREFWDSSDVLIAHADNFTTSDLSGLISAHNFRASHIDVTMLLFYSDTPQSCGIVELDELNIITGYFEKVAQPPTNLANGAVFLFSPKVFQRFFQPMLSEKRLSLCADIVPTMIGSMQGWLVDGPYMDIGTPVSYKHANDIIKL
ncbi:mannose-1-phosphate guanylyltransferase [Pseudoalteromonas sp. MSK9-3]|uniref:nucleotidyltransferase family protein n=1 Tax=Pseudoalteromonas sp. MSK9-3 TaxID=1897633 RepID=UPI000E6CA2CF|nr:nucleotidyltransferase family protein [Pseudoalteromonas sp. MSK9-3]RJE75748.1 mannose-1-phosphate guanylyltransferase [Pseudoalteromonas sp. MSK9-3]